MTSGEDQRRTLIERAEMNVDSAAVERRRREAAVRARAERIETLRRVLFQDACRGQRDIESLTNEAAAARVLVSAHKSAHDRLVLAILQVAIDNRWSDVVRAGARHFAFNRMAVSSRSGPGGTA